VKLNTSIHEVPRWRILALYLYCYVCPGVNLPFHKVKVKQSRYRPVVAQRVPGS
jgi:hypothetical protein